MSALDPGVRAEIVGILAVEAEQATVSGGKEAAAILMDAVLTVLCSAVSVADGRREEAGRLAAYLVAQVDSMSEGEGA